MFFAVKIRRGLKTGSAIVESPFFFGESLMPRGRPPKPKHLHELHGTWRNDRHGPRSAPPESDAENPWKAILRLPEGPPRGPRELDPLEELLQRDGIEILPEDRKPKTP
jgi:hypothetical protein